ncbi:MAG TPA: carboxymuconolactone decarboxylase family protein [Ruminiclostridium sp.]
MGAFIKPPNKIPLFLKLGIWISQKVTGKDLLVAKLLSWYPKAAVGSAILESFVAHRDKDIDERILKLIRMQASFSACCPFCIDMNSFEFEKQGITMEELKALQGTLNLAEVTTFSKREVLAIEYARLISRTPLGFPREFIDELRENFKEREIVILASTVAQVNYWARLIQALGIPPAGFSEQCIVQNNLTK